MGSTPAKTKLDLIKKVQDGEKVARVCREIGVSRKTFYQWLKRYQKSRPQNRIFALSDRRFKKRFPVETLDPKERLLLINKVKEKEAPVAKLCRQFGISRKTFYKWQNRFEKEGAVLEALFDARPKGEAHWRFIPAERQQLVLEAVLAHPEYSCHRLAAKISQVGHHGIQNILQRKGLSTYEARLAYQKAQEAVFKPVPAPTLAPVFNLPMRIFRMAIAPFATIPKKDIFRVFGLAFVSSFVFSTSAHFWLRMVQQAPAENRIGLIFATISIACGTFFFLYSMKYYLTLAIVLGFSRHIGESGPPSSASGETSARQGGLQPNLDHIKLERKPFVSIHLPVYNERKVVDRLLTACTSLDYENYEVVVVDDSTDETTQILKDWEKHPRVKIIHRESRAGFKGGALREALRASSPKAEFVIVFDADFIPYPDTISQFLKYFQSVAGTLTFINPKSEILNSKQIQNSNDQNSKQFSASDLDISASRSNIAAVQGYQWHVLNKSENWITRGVRSEYAGSYVVERSGAEVLGALKMIAGSVYMVRADLLRKYGWGTSITEDFELTLKLYQDGYKVVYTPYVQGPAECVATIKRLVRQRMRWAEGHSYNIHKMFVRLLFGSFKRSDLSSGRTSPGKVWVPSKLTLVEKLEFLYLSPYYLQAFFFMIGTFCWLISETVFRARLPFWTSLWGWSLVLTNLFSLPLMNTVGLFLEESEERDYGGIISFIFLSYLLVPFQAYASVKGFLEKEEGPWFRTPKTGKITDIFTRGRFYRWISGILPGRIAPAMRMSPRMEIARMDANIRINSQNLNSPINSYLALATANNRFDKFLISRKQARWVGRIFLVILLILSTTILSLAPTVSYFIKPKETQAKGFGMLAGPDLAPEKAQLSAPLKYSEEFAALKEGEQKELIQERSETSKTFIKKIEGKQEPTFVWEGTIGPIHYRNSPEDPNELWKEISTSVIRAEGDYEFKNETNSFKSYFKKNSKKENLVKYQEGESFITFTLEDNELGKLNKVEGYAKDNQFIYPKAYEEIDVKYSITSSRLLEEFVLYQPREISKITQRVHFENTYFKEEDGAITFYSNQTNKPVWEIPKPKMYELETQNSKLKTQNAENYGLHYEIKKDGDDYLITKVIDSKGKHWLADESRVYPVVIDITVDKQVAAGADDGRQYDNGGFYAGGTAGIVGYDVGGVLNGHVFLRWTGVTIGGTVTTSYIEIYGSSFGGTPEMKIYGVDEDNPTAPTSTAEFNADPLTTAAVDWDVAFPGDSWNQSPSLNSIFQELVESYTISNDAVMAQVKNDHGVTGSDEGNWCSFFENTGYGAKLHIEYTSRVDTSTSSSATAYSFQRKTWYDGTRLWSAFFTGETWWNSSWQYRFKYTITNSGVGETLTDFPLHIDLTSDAPANFWTHVSFEDGRDIRVVDENDSTDLTGQAHLEDFSKASSKGHIWVKRTIAASGNTEEVYVYYGNSGASATWNEANTYNTNYVMVQHMGGASYSALDDSTTNDNDVTSQVSSPIYQQTGKIDYAVDFDGIGDNADRVQVSDAPELSFSADFTVELWVKLDQLSITIGHSEWPLSKKHTGTPWTEYAFRQMNWGGNEYFVFSVLNSAGTWYDSDKGGGLLAGTWYHVVGVRDTSNVVRVYVNGVGSTSTETFSGSTWDSASYLGIGSDWQTGTDGVIDEVRISNIARPAEWIEFAYLSDKGDGGTAGSEDTGKGVEFWYSTDWGATWSQNTSATLGVNTNDFTIEGDSSDLFIVYTDGYDIKTNEDTGTYPATNFAWGASPTTVYDGSSSTDEYDYPTIAKDSNNKVWITTAHHSSTNYLSKAIQSTNANDISAWGTATTLDTSTNSNKYGTIVSLGSGNMYAVWIDGTAIEGKKYNGTSWDASATAIDTGVSGLTKNMSAVVDTTNYDVHLIYIDDEATDQVSYKRWDNGTSTWDASATLVADAADNNDAYATLSYDISGSDLYALWIDTSASDIFYSSCDFSTECNAAAEWAAETNWKSTGTNTYVTSNYSGAGMIFAQWTEGTGSPYSVMWDYIIIPEKLLLFLGLGLVIPGLLRRRRCRLKSADPREADEPKTNL